jgi:tyrosyl-tRNA synthetase
MSGLKSEFLRVLTERGYVHQCTDLTTLDAKAATGPIAGHRPIVLMGGGTTKIGDPSGKDEARQLLSDEKIDANIAGIRKVFDSYLTFGEGPTGAVLANNAHWLDTLAYIPLLRDVGRHFTINRMLTFDSVKMRLEREQPLTFLEFNYMILQAYDFVELHGRLGCVLQMGGSDQWGNIVNGVELGRRMKDAALFGLTTPLITLASGAKMGKTASGAVWLSPDRLSPYGFWQFWRNTEDADVGRFLRLFTELPLDEIARLEALQGAEINDAKKILAFEATRLCHGTEAAETAAETARRTFEDGAASEGLPTVDVSRERLSAGVKVLDLLREAGLVPSNGEGRRLIRQGAIRLNDAPVDDEAAVLGPEALATDGTAKLSAGKKRHALIRAV